MVDPVVTLRALLKTSMIYFTLKKIAGIFATKLVLLYSDCISCVKIFSEIMEILWHAMRGLHSFLLLQWGQPLGGR